MRPTHASGGRNGPTRALAKILQLAPRRARRSFRSFDEYPGAATDELVTRRRSHEGKVRKEAAEEAKENTREIVSLPPFPEIACAIQSREMLQCNRHASRGNYGIIIVWFILTRQIDRDGPCWNSARVLDRRRETMQFAAEDAR